MFLLEAFWAGKTHTYIIPSEFYISDVQKAGVSKQVTAMGLREPP